MNRILVPLLALALLTGTAAAYTHVVHEQRSELVTLAWRNTAQPIQLRLNELTDPQLPNLIEGSDPRGAIERALTTWPAVSSIELRLGETSIASAGRDGTSIVSFVDTPANEAELEMAGDPIALTLYFFIEDALVEADVLFNPLQQFTTTATSEDEIEAQDAADVEAVAVHELGHAIGLNHSGVESATMWAFSSLGQRQLDPDDIAGARALYGQGSRVQGFKGPSEDESPDHRVTPRTLGPSNASIAGTVRVNGRPAFGAHVVAVAADGPVFSALTLPDGTYRIDALPPGSYTAYVEPLDGPHSAAFVDGCVRFGNMGGAGIFDGADLTSNFPTTFYGGNTTPIELTLEAEHLVLADFELPEGTSDLNPVRIGPGTAGNSFIRLAEFPLALSAGATQWVAIAGPGLDFADDAGIGVIGEGVTVDTAEVQRPEVNCGGSQFPTMIFPVAVAIDAVPGGRTLLIASGDDLAAFTGAIEIQATTEQLPCVGDCDGGGTITVADLVRGVNISLDRAAIGTCSNFDRDGNQRVTIDELIAGVNGLLVGCA